MIQAELIFLQLHLAALLRVYCSCIVPGCKLSGTLFVLCCQSCCSLHDWGAKNAVLSANETAYAPAAVACLAAAWSWYWECCFVIFLLIALERHLLGPPCHVLMCIVPWKLVVQTKLLVPCSAASLNGMCMPALARLHFTVFALQYPMFL